MAIAKKCDRCGKMYERYNKDYSTNDKDMNGFATVCISTNGGNYITQEVYDLCEECKEELNNWFSNINVISSDEVGESINEYLDNDKEDEDDDDDDDEDEDEKPKIIIQEPESDGDKNG